MAYGIKVLYISSVKYPLLIYKNYLTLPVYNCPLLISNYNVYYKKL